MSICWRLHAALKDNVTNGNLTLNDDGSFRYDPQGFSGDATFTYQIDDGVQLSNPITVTLVVNTAPTATADTYQIPEDTVLTTTSATGVLGNDTDADGNALTAEIEDSTVHGQLTFNADGSFLYGPDANYFGADSFSYRVTDGVDTSSVIQVQLDVQSVNDAPSAADDAYFTLPGRALAISAAFGVLTNDADVENADLVAALVSRPSHGQIGLSADGSFTYTPDAGYQGTDTFTYRAGDGQSQSDPASVTLTITPRPLAISEVMASNADTLITMLRAAPTDEFVGEQLSPDWFELHNLLGQPIDIGGLHLTDNRDNAMKWQVPAGTVIPASGYLVVFASGLDIRDTELDENGLLHTNFQLDPNGEYLAITSPSGAVIDAFDPYPQMRTHISYGVDDSGNAQYFENPTPGNTNTAGVVGLVEDTQFSVKRGFYSEPFQLTISTATQGAQIRYTTDGTIPTDSNGTIYEGPITISGTTTLRRGPFTMVWSRPTPTRSRISSSPTSYSKMRKQPLTRGFPIPGVPPHPITAWMIWTSFPALPATWICRSRKHRPKSRIHCCRYHHFRSC